MKYFIKNMVTIRCKMVVKSELEKLGIRYTDIELGEVELKEPLTDRQCKRLKVGLRNAGLELMDDKRAMLIEKIKNVIIEMVHYSDELPTVKFSQYLSEKLNYDYTYLSNTFSEVKGITIEHYIIMHKIEKVKELILYGELNLSEIAYKMHYSSSAHLSNQFKKVTGLTPSFFKSLKQQRRVTLDSL
ncbi:MAG TPA: AraC family transcriptional regulator [Chitinophagales bacterium]|nr:AraC family transcriptional regulator [Chitinophagales bacterium]